MSHESLRLRRSLAALSLGAAGVLSGVLGCQGIADIPDVSYSASVRRVLRKDLE